MKIHIFAHCRNESAICGFWARHYSAFADRITVFDDNSDDGTQAILAQYPKVEVIQLGSSGLDERAMLELAHSTVSVYRGIADIVMWPDMDEFLHHPKMRECLSRYLVSGYNVIRTLGMNMMGADLPADDGVSQLTDIYRTGVRAPVYSKPIIVTPESGVRWSHGKHALANEHELRVMPDYKHYEPEEWRIKLLHFRYLTPEYCRARNARQYARSTSKETAWSCSPTYRGEHSPEWVAATMRKARDVVSESAHWYPPGELDA